MVTRPNHGSIKRAGDPGSVPGPGAGPPAADAPAFAFDRFRFIPSKQMLLAGGKPVRIGSRALDILAALVERPGEVVAKNDLLARVWPDTFVEAGNLKVNIAALRRALGEGAPGPRYIATASGRGYRFVAPVERIDAPFPAPAATPRGSPSHNLPRSSGRMFGRDDAIDSILRLLPQHRSITIVGPGGIGKTTVALAAATESLDRYPDGVWLIDLASLRDPRFIPSALASATGIAVHDESSIHSFATQIRDKRMLVVLDSCEHVVEAAAQAVELMTDLAPETHVLATSREPLRAGSERIVRLPPLDAPPDRGDISATQALAFPAVQLFVERANSSLDSFVLQNDDAPVIAEICRRLDGIALAIELAATRMDAFRAPELLALLDDRFRLLEQGRRTALPRHRTLSAAIDWSYQLLPDDERLVLRRLGIVAGTFTLETATAVAADGDVAAADIVAGLANLVSKSLVSADVSGATVQYRLLDTMRAYALIKLRESGEFEATARRHARHLEDILARAETDSSAQPVASWLATYARRLDDIRSALEHASDQGEDAAIAIALTVAAIPLWMQLSHVLECQGWVEKALKSKALTDARDEMRLNSSLGTTLLYTSGPVPKIETILIRALAIARRLADEPYQLRILWSLSVYQVYAGQCLAALSSLKTYRRVANRAGDALDRFGCDRLVATTIHYFGQQAAARRRLDRALAGFALPVQQAQITRFQFEQRGTAKGTLANILWLQGFPERALALAWEAIEDARAADHPLSLCAAFGFTVFPLALYAGDHATAQRALARLQEQLGKQPLSVWRILARCMDGLLRDLLGEATGLAILRDAIEELRAAHFRLRYTYYLGALAQALGRAGDIAGAEEVVKESLAWSERSGEHWFTPELLRLKGELLRRRGGARSSAAARTCFERSLSLAHQQGALSWALRAATSLAELHRGSGREEEGRRVLAPVYARFTEGFQSVDLARARAFLAPAPG